LHGLQKEKVMEKIQESTLTGGQMGTHVAPDTDPENSTAGHDKAHKTATQLRDRASETRDQIRDYTREVGGQAKELGDEAMAVASAYYEQGREKMREWEGTLETQLREKPLQFLLIAGGVGLLLGLLWKRR
jgi:ElaB/YqjD/DUF883 family membrane-anchored ribosome-binding protein